MTSQMGIIGSASQFIRYYQAGIINTIFGYTIVAAMIAVGINVYVAQLLGHTAGTAFNYFTYSKYAFRDEQGSIGRFIASYIINYLFGLAALAASLQFIRSPYIAGAIAVIFVSFVNYFILKKLVFTRRRTV